MKNFLFLLALVMTGTLFCTSIQLTAAASPAPQISLDMADNTCVLYVENTYGSAARSVKVSTDVSGGISCSGGRSFYTDSDGRVELRWVSGCYLKTIYIDGRSYDVDFKDGGSYTINMR